MQRIATYSFIVISLLLAVSFVPASAMEGATSSATAYPTKEKLQPTLQARREELKATITQERNAFKERLAKIKDERKRTIVDRLNTKVPTLNQTLTTRMQTALAKMTNHLNEVKTKLATLKQQGKDITTVENAITSAEQAIATAVKAVESQQEKQYTITITTENNLRQTIGPVIKQMETDLRATYQLVLAAHKAVKAVDEALRALLPQALGNGQTATEAAE